MLKSKKVRVVLLVIGFFAIITVLGWITDSDLEKRERCDEYFRIVHEAYEVGRMVPFREVIPDDEEEFCLEYENSPEGQAKWGSR
jgi:hypothetical protein